MKGAVEAGVSVERVSFGYGGTPVLDDVSLRIEPGEFFAFLGPSGSGKTTLLRLIAGFGTPSAGAIRIGGRDVGTLPPWRRNVGLVFQNYALWPHMTVAANVAFGLEMRKVGRAEIGRRVAAALEMVELGALADRRPAQLSGGQQQRVALARTLVVEPDVLLLDEPLSNLDAKLRVEMRAELLALQRKTGLTTIYVTHDQEEANATADRMAVLDGGRIQQIGAPIELYDRPANRFVAGFLGAANTLEGRIEPGDHGPEFRGDGLALKVDPGAPRGPAAATVRPQDIFFADAPDVPPGPAATVAVRIEHREFMGSVLRYTVRAGERRLLVDAPHRAGARLRAPGDPAVLRIPAGCVRLLGPENRPSG